MKHLIPCLALILSYSILGADVPLREVTLMAPASAVKVDPARLKPYLDGNQVVLKVKGLIFEPAAGKSIKGEPSEDNSTPFRAAINYHRALRNDGVDSIASYWHPASQQRVKEQFSKPEVLDSTKDLIETMDNIDLLGLVMLGGREVVYIRYTNEAHPFICIKADGRYYLVNDPGLKTMTAIATAAFDSGSVTMASR